MNNNDPDIPITVVIPVKNEEANLALCLSCLKRFKEVVIVDSNSDDKTPEIAQEFGFRVVNFNWNGEYPKKRNWYLLNETPSQPWVLFLDADEFINNEFCDAVKKAISQDGINGFWLSYQNYFLGNPLRFGIPQRKLALFRVGAGLYERIEESFWSRLDMEIHEHPIIEGKVREIGARIDHKDYKGLATFIGKHLEYARWEASRFKTLKNSPDTWLHFTKRQTFKYSHIRKSWYPAFYFCYTFFIKGGFLDGHTGFQYAYYKSWYFRTIRLLIEEDDLEA